MFPNERGYAGQVVAAPYPWPALRRAPAPLAGCPAIKPAPETSCSACALAEALDAAGLPAGLVSMLPAGCECAEYLAIGLAALGSG
jgi:aldehyde dehydrogenase (NAD+)